MCLNKLFLLKQKLQACWTVLYTFGYDANLNLSEEYVNEKSACNFDIGSELELSSEGVTFVKRLWSLYSRSKIAHISIVSQIFATMKEGCPFIPSEIAMIVGDQIELKNWVSIWQMLVHTNYKLAFRYALYLGYSGNIKKFIKEVKGNNWSLFEEMKKSVYECVVVSRLPTILNILVDSVQNESPRSAAFPLPKGEALVVTELDAHSLALSRTFSRCSACSLVYDGTNESGQFIKSVCEQLPAKLPTAIIDVSNQVPGPLERYLGYFQKKSLPVFRLRLPVENPEALLEFISKLVKNKYLLSSTS